MALNFICVRCKEASARQSSVITDSTCAKCGQHFPSFEGIPFLYPEAEATWFVWQQQMRAAIQSLDREISSLSQETKTPGITRPTYNRLSVLKKFKSDFKAHLITAFGGIVGTSEKSFSVPQILKSRLPITQELLGYLTNVFRDWAWGEAENQLSLSQVSRALDKIESPKTKNILFIGSGSSRLGFDVQVKYGFEECVCVDLNPYLLWIAKQMAEGKEISSVEFPKAPKTDADVAVAQKLSARSQSRPKMAFVLADATHLPFEEKVFDVVAMPWFIDILPGDAAAFLKYLNPFIKDGGALLHYGSLAFFRKSPSQNYILSEYGDLAKSFGFAQELSHAEYSPYLNSPHSNYHRLENVHTILFRKEKSLSFAPYPSHLPDWIIHTDRAIPALKEFQEVAQNESSYLQILSMIDGKKSIQQMASALAKKSGASAEQLTEAVRLSLADIYENKMVAHRI